MCRARECKLNQVIKKWRRQKTYEQRTLIGFKNVKIVEQQVMTEKNARIDIEFNEGRIDCTFAIVHCSIEMARICRLTRKVFAHVILCQ